MVIEKYFSDTWRYCGGPTILVQGAQLIRDWMTHQRCDKDLIDEDVYSTRIRDILGDVELSCKATSNEQKSENHPTNEFPKCGESARTTCNGRRLIPDSILKLSLIRSASRIWLKSVHKKIQK